MAKVVLTLLRYRIPMQHNIDKTIDILKNPSIKGDKYDKN
jgi:hypothetical protein